MPDESFFMVMVHGFWHPKIAEKRSEERDKNQPARAERHAQPHLGLSQAHYYQHRHHGEHKIRDCPADCSQAVAGLVRSDHADHGKHGHEALQDFFNNNQHQDYAGDEGKLYPDRQMAAMSRLSMSGKSDMGHDGDEHGEDAG